MDRIAILVPSLKKGGAEKQACLLASALLEKHEVIMLVHVPEAGLEEENIKLSKLSTENIYLLSGNSCKRLWNIYRILRKYKPKYLFCYLTKPDFWGPIIGRLSGIKYIYQGLRNAKLPRSKIFLERIGNIFASGVIVNNYAGVETFSHHGIRNQIVIPNCYLDPQNAVTRIGRDIITVITVGRFVEQKDYHTAIAAVAAAMEHDDRIRFKIIGHGELEENVKGWVKEYAIDEKTEILINPKGIMDHLKNADIYLSTSLFEGTSNSIMEALDASLPVIATTVGDNDKLVVNETNGYLVMPKDIDHISKSIINLCREAELRVRFGIAGNSLLKKKYSFDTFKRHYLDLIESN